MLYDLAADRWVMSQFTSSNPYGECVAISTSADPTGPTIATSSSSARSVFYDYPHLGVWPDGYYMSANRFGGIFQSYAGPQRHRLRPQPHAAGAVGHLSRRSKSTTYGTLLLSDLDGPTPPPAGAPNSFLRVTLQLDTYLRYFWQIMSIGPRPLTPPSAGRLT